jgi:hypothetical protein
MKVRIHCETWESWRCETVSLGVLYDEPDSVREALRLTGVTVKREQILDHAGNRVWTLGRKSK